MSGDDTGPWLKSRHKKKTASAAVLDDRDRCEEVIGRLLDRLGIDRPERWSGGFADWLNAVEVIADPEAVANAVAAYVEQQPKLTLMDWGPDKAGLIAQSDQADDDPIRIAKLSPDDVALAAQYAALGEHLKPTPLQPSSGAHYKSEGWSAPCWVITTSEGFTYPISDDDMIAVIRDVKAWSDGITERLAKIHVCDVCGTVRHETDMATVMTLDSVRHYCHPSTSSGPTCYMNAEGLIWP